MKHRTLRVISLAGIFILLFSSSFAFAAGPKEVLVGEVLPLSGGSASQGAQVRAGAEIAADEINSMGGIKNLDGAKIKLLFGDSKSQPDGGVAEAERLITREKIAVQLGCFNSAVTFPTTEVAQRYKPLTLSTLRLKMRLPNAVMSMSFVISTKPAMMSRK